MKFRDYVDACLKTAVWCLEEASSCDNPAEMYLWLDAAAHWKERAIKAEADLLKLQAAAGGKPEEP